MLLKKLQLRKFRNYDELEIDFNSCGNLLFGNNGQGKTNLLEAIYYLSVFRSFRKNSGKELACWGSEEFFLSGFFDTDNAIERNIKIEWTNVDSKQVYYENERINKLSDIAGLYPTVILSPESMDISQGAPGDRRKFLDVCISIADKEYLIRLGGYKRILKQRNNVLNSQSGIDKDLLEAWTERLIEEGSFIIEKRIEVIAELREIAIAQYKVISDDKEIFDVNYLPSFDPGENTKESFRKELLRKADEELRRRSTVVGPHKDDVGLSLNEKEARKFASQGQHKTIMLSLKAAELSWLAEKKNTKPAILLDDLFALLDTKRITAFIGILKDYGQFFITANLGIDPEKTLNEVGFKSEDFSQFHVEAGKVVKKC